MVTMRPSTRTLRLTQRRSRIDPGAPTPAHMPLDHDVESVIGDCGLYEHGRRQPGRIPLHDAAAAATRSDGVLWVGLQHPDADDIAEVAQQFQLPALAVEDAVLAHQRPKLEAYGDILFAILKPVHYVDSEQVVEVGEIALFIGPRFVVSVRHGDTDVLSRVRRELDTTGYGDLPCTPATLLYRIADHIVDDYEQALDHINGDVDDVESRVFTHADDDLAARIYSLKREIAEFRRAVVPLVSPLERLVSGAVPLVDEAAAPYFRDVQDHLLRAVDAIETHDRLLSDVLQTNVAQIGVRNSHLAIQQNEDMRKISAWAAIALVPTAIAGVYGMNFDNMPELTWQYGYFLVLGVIAGVCGVLYRLFRRNNWL